MSASAYGAGSPVYEDAELQKHQLEGRLRVARGVATRAAASGDDRTAAKWNRTADELLDRLLEVRGR